MLMLTVLASEITVGGSSCNQYAHANADAADVLVWTSYRECLHVRHSRYDVSISKVVMTKENL